MANNTLPTLWHETHWPILKALRTDINHLFSVDKDGDFPLIERRQANLRFMPRLNIAETEEAMEITAELPGLTSADVNVSLDGNDLIIQGKREAETEEKRKNYHLLESRYGAFYRAMQLPFVADPAKISATCKNGVLTVVVPKSAESKSRTRQITVR